MPPLKTFRSQKPRAKKSGAGTRPSARRVGLQSKVVGFLIIISMVPLAVAAVLINQAAQVAHNFASNEAAFLRPPLHKAKSAYLALIAAKRDLYYPEVARRVAAMPEIIALADSEPGHDQHADGQNADGQNANGQNANGQNANGQNANGQNANGQNAGGQNAGGQNADDQNANDQNANDQGANDQGASDQLFDQLLTTTRELAGIAVHNAKGVAIASRQSLAPAGVRTAQWREITVERPIAGTGATLILTFAADLDLQADYAQLSRALQDAERIDEVRSALPSSYRTAFLLLVGGVVVLVSLTGIWLARRFTRRIFALLIGTRRVARGDLTARVDLAGRDELAELSWAFNRMVEDLEHDRDQIAYLQRVGAWQDVARKLAHEIKNPLTPIQLAVQQCVSSYKGDDTRFQRLLRDTEEIVTEEISSLRRLVDAFRTLGQLPRVDAKPLALATVVDDLTKDPMLAAQLDLDPPAEPVMIRGDRMLLRRVLTNLVENGMHAGQGAGRAGKVTISWRADHDAGRVRLMIDDEGPGVPAEQRTKIFEPYITHKEQGTGLGLTISKKIALEHGGTLELSREPSSAGGARFVLSLPLAEEDDSEPAASIDASESA